MRWRLERVHAVRVEYVHAVRVEYVHAHGLPRRRTVGPDVLLQTVRYSLRHRDTELEARAPSQEQSNFVTWVAPDDSQAIRFLVPITVYKPGTTTEVPAPDPGSYLAYLMGQSAHGAHLTDVTKITVGGEPATELTATTDQSLDGSLGCQKKGLDPGDCYGLQPDVNARMAVIPRGSHTLLVWLRTSATMTKATRATDIKEFDAILASIKFR